MARNINNINTQDSNKEIITPEGKSTSIKDKVAEQLKNKKAIPETVETEEKPVQNILVNAKSKVKSAQKKANKAKKEALDALVEAESADGTDKEDKANEKAANKINKYNKATDKAIDAQMNTDADKHGKVLAKHGKVLAKYGFTLTDDGSDEDEGTFNMNEAKETEKTAKATEKPADAKTSDKVVIPEQAKNVVAETKDNEAKETEKTAKPVETKSALDKMVDDFKDYGTKAKTDAFESYDDMVDYAEKIFDINSYKLEKKLDNKENAAKLKDFLPHFAISRYLNNEFGNIKKDKYGKPLNPAEKKQADRTLTYFLLDKIGTALINSSNMMSGLSPSQKSALQKYNETQMDNALARDDKTKDRILNEKINTNIKDNDTMRQLGIDRVDIGKGALTRTLSYVIDSVNDVEAMRRLEQKKDFFKKDGLSDKDIATMAQVQWILSSDADDTIKAQARITEAQIEKAYATTNAEKQEAYYKIKNNQLLLAYADEKAALELEKLQLANNLSSKQVDQIVEMIKDQKIKNKYAPSKEIIGQVAQSVGVATSVVDSVAGIFKLK